MWLLSKKALIRDSGILDGFRDCHCHLLPGVDDGVQNADDTIQILDEWEALGIKEVWLTPHIMEDIPNEPETLRRVFNVNLNFNLNLNVDLNVNLNVDLNGNGNGKQFSIKLHLAAEHMMDGLFLKRLEKNDVMPIGKGRDRLLVETSYYTPPMNMTDMIERVKTRGYEPILAHPERYQYMDKKDYRHWKERGVLFQLNVPSLVGAYGPEVRRKAEWLLKENLYDYCGTDTHSIDQMRMFLNSEISKKTAKKVKRISDSQKL